MDEFAAALTQMFRHIEEISKELDSPYPKVQNIQENTEYIKSAMRSIGRAEGFIEACNFLIDTFIKKSHTQ